MAKQEKGQPVINNAENGGVTSVEKLTINDLKDRYELIVKKVGDKMSKEMAETKAKFDELNQFLRNNRKNLSPKQKLRFENIKAEFNVLLKMFEKNQKLMEESGKTVITTEAPGKKEVLADILAKGSTVSMPYDEEMYAQPKAKKIEPSLKGTLDDMAKGSVVSMPHDESNYPAANKTVSADKPFDVRENINRSKISEFRAKMTREAVDQELSLLQVENISNNREVQKHLDFIIEAMATGGIAAESINKLAEIMKLKPSDMMGLISFQESVIDSRAKENITHDNKKTMAAKIAGWGALSIGAAKYSMGFSLFAIPAVVVARVLDTKRVQQKEGKEFAEGQVKARTELLDKDSKIFQDIRNQINESLVVAKSEQVNKSNEFLTQIKAEIQDAAKISNKEERQEKINDIREKIKSLSESVQLITEAEYKRLNDGRTEKLSNSEIVSLGSSARAKFEHDLNAELEIELNKVHNKSFDDKLSGVVDKALPTLKKGLENAGLLKEGNSRTLNIAVMGLLGLAARGAKEIREVTMAVGGILAGGALVKAFGVETQNNELKIITSQELAKLQENPNQEVLLSVIGKLEAQLNNDKFKIENPKEFILLQKSLDNLDQLALNDIVSLEGKRKYMKNRSQGLAEWFKEEKNAKDVRRLKILAGSLAGAVAMPFVMKEVMQGVQMATDKFHEMFPSGEHGAVVAAGTTATHTEAPRVVAAAGLPAEHIGAGEPATVSKFEFTLANGEGVGQGLIHNADKMSDDTLRELINKQTEHYQGGQYQNYLDQHGLTGSVDANATHAQLVEKAKAIGNLWATDNDPHFHNQAVGAKVFVEHGDIGATRHEQVYVKPQVVTAQTYEGIKTIESNGAALNGAESSWKALHGTEYTDADKNVATMFENLDDQKIKVGITDDSYNFMRDHRMTWDAPNHTIIDPEGHKVLIDLDTKNISFQINDHGDFEVLQTNGEGIVKPTIIEGVKIGNPALNLPGSHEEVPFPIQNPKSMNLEQGINAMKTEGIKITDPAEALLKERGFLFDTDKHAFVHADANGHVTEYAVGKDASIEVNGKDVMIKTEGKLFAIKPDNTLLQANLPPAPKPQGFFSKLFFGGK